MLSFAAWTLLYCLGLPTQWSLWPSGWIWVGLTLVILVWRVRLALPADAGVDAAAVPDPLAPPTATSPPLPAPRDLLLVGGLILVATSAVGGLIWTPGTFRVTWAALVLGIVALVGWSWLTGRVGPDADDTEDSRPRPVPPAWSAHRSSACSP